VQTLDPGIFRAHDVRGVYGDQIDDEAAYTLGRAFARLLGDLTHKPTDRLNVGLGRDMRLTAPELSAMYREGMTAEGAHVLDAGQVGTEMLAFLVGSRGLDGGLMCTASHDPKQYTGAKFVGEGASALSGDLGVAELRRKIEEGLGAAAGNGTSEEVDVYAEFHDAALRFVDPENVKPLKVVVDAGHGMGGAMVGPLLEGLPGELVTLRWAPDGELPGGEPDPFLEPNRRLLADTVREAGADLGIAWDGDADRCLFVDDQGEPVEGDFLTAILAEHLLTKQPGAAIVYDARASRAVADRVEAAGGSAHVARAGHASFEARMRDEGAIFGGEGSGHHCFRDFYNAGSGTVPALLMLERLSVEDRRLSSIMADLRFTYFLSGEIDATVEDGEAKLRELEDRYGEAAGGRVTRLDGLSIDYDGWRFDVRPSSPSSPEAVLRLNLESLVSREDMERRRDELLGVIRG
jgi:phosphomannomutase